MIFSKNMFSQFLYRLNTRENMKDFVNQSKIISANDDKDVNLETLPRGTSNK
jgi:hypothetical protein